MRNFKIGAGESAQRFNGDDDSAPMVWNGVESYSITSGGLRLRNVATASLPTTLPNGNTLPVGTTLYDTTSLTIKVWNGSTWTSAGGGGGGGGLTAVVEDTTPELGGELDAGGNNIVDLGDVTFKTGAAGGTLRTGTSAADKFTLQAYKPNTSEYITLIEADAGNNVRLQIPVNYLDLEDATDTTKIARLSSAGISTGTTRTYTFPDASGTFLLDAGNSTINGVKTFTSDPIIPDEVYGASWDGSLEPPTKNAVYDKIQTLGAAGRTVLGANRTYYVRTDGSDSNDGLTDSAGGAFLTIQKALDVVSDTLDLAGYDVVIQVRDGTYSGAVGVPRFTGKQGIAGVTLRGNTATPANCIISRAGVCIEAYEPTSLLIEGFKLTSSGNVGLLVGYDAVVKLGVMDFGACTGHIFTYDGGIAERTAAYTISGAAGYHMFSERGGQIATDTSPFTITLTGTPAFSSYFAYAGSTGRIFDSGVTYSGAATGARYLAELNGVINTFGGGASYFPGDSAGSVATGGQYA